MKRAQRTPRKLNLKRETVRQLGRIELAQANTAAGGPVVARDTEIATCPWTHMAATATAVCGGG